MKPQVGKITLLMGHKVITLHADNVRIIFRGSFDLFCYLCEFTAVSRLVIVLTPDRSDGKYFRLWIIAGKSTIKSSAIFSELG